MITCQGKLTPEVIQQIVEIIQQGNYPEVAVESLGITERTYRRWLARGNKALEECSNDTGLDVAEADRLYAEFVREIKRASALGEIADVNTINKGDKSAIPIMMKLSRRHRKRWAENVPDTDQLRTGAEFLARLIEALQRPQLDPPTLTEIPQECSSK